MSFTDLVGQSFTLRQLREVVDTFQGSPRQLRNLQAQLAAEEARWAGFMKEQYEPVAERSSKEMTDNERIAEQIEEMFTEILDDLQNNRTTPKQAAKDVQAGRRDLANLAKAKELAMRSEENAWERIEDKDPADFQDAVRERFPAMFTRGGGGLAVITAEALNKP